MLKRKRLSKRLSTTKREKIHRKIRQHHKKQRKDARMKTKLPKSVLLTTEEKENLRNIQEQAEIRNNEILSEPAQEIDPNIAQVQKCLDFDVFIQVLDSRDTEGCRNKAVEDFLSENNRSFHNVDRSSDLGKEILAHKRFLIFGKEKVGKFEIQKKIENAVKNCEIKTLTASNDSFTTADVLRNVVSELKYDPIFTFEKLMEFFNPLELRNFYKLKDFKDSEEFLLFLGQKLGSEKRKRRIMSAGAMKVIKDIQNEKILWRKVGEQFEFVFSQ